MQAFLSAVPTFEILTARLRLRQHRLDDLDARAGITGNPAHMHFVGGAQDRTENFNRVLRYVGHWALFDHGLFGIEERGSGKLVGEAGLGNFHRMLGADFDDFPEAAWLISTQAQGQGYATEAMSAAMLWHEERFGPVRVVCIIDPANAASLRVAAKLGFAPFREAMFKDRHLILHERRPSPPQAG